MALGLFNYPQPTKERGQRSIDIGDLFLTRFTPPWGRPPSFSAYQWRAWVLNQPVAIVCRETLIANVIALDWKITPRDSNYREELNATVRYYTKLFAGGGDYASLSLDYSGLVEWLVADLLDTPFGTGAELGRKGDAPGGRVAWIRPLDAGTLFPTLNEEYPVVQYWTQPYDAVAFPYWSIVRAYMSPHSFIYREGWGMAPPEKIYFALELLNRGDKYYANLLLDVPTAGILDLGDMEKDSAEEWITAFKTFVQDESVAFRVPVLYEHNNKVEFIPFGKVPNDIMFDKITMKYAALTTAGYGLSLSDIGLQTTTASGETLAGSIRQERRTRKTGLSRVKAKVKAFFDRILPDTLEFNFVDVDEEVNVGLGRARLATSQAFASFRQLGMFSAQELRSQAIQDGLINISVPDEIPPDAKPDPNANPNGLPGLVGNPKPPSSGGFGEIKSLVDTVSFKAKSKELDKFVSSIVSEISPYLVQYLSVSEDEIEITKSILSEQVLSDEDGLEFSTILSELIKNKSLGSFNLSALETMLKEREGLDVKSFLQNLRKNLNAKLSEFLGKSIVVTLAESDLQSESIVEDTKNRITNLLQDYISLFVESELRSMMSGGTYGISEW